MVFGISKFPTALAFVIHAESEDFAVACQDHDVGFAQGHLGHVMAFHLNDLSGPVALGGVFAEEEQIPVFGHHGRGSAVGRHL